jgi:hypothetical protein
MARIKTRETDKRPTHSPQDPSSQRREGQQDRRYSPEETRVQQTRSHWSARDRDNDLYERQSW